MLLPRKNNEKSTSTFSRNKWFFLLLLLWDVKKCIFFSRKKSLEGIKRKRSEAEEDSEVEDPGMEEGQAADAESDDDKEYYRQAVGEEPDEGIYECLFANNPLPDRFYFNKMSLFRYVPTDQKKEAASWYVL